MTATLPNVPSIAATIAAMPMGLPRAKGPSLDAAIDAARAAVVHGMANGVKVSVLIADSVGETVVLLSGDGAGVRSQLIARTKVNIVAKYRMPSGDVETKAKTDPQLAAEVAADPNIGVLRSGGMPVIKNGETIAIVGVSGAIGFPHLDAECAQVAMARLLAT